ncbi:MAG: hypothetical protein ACK5NK_16765 [Niabella sp.]
MPNILEFTCSKSLELPFLSIMNGKQTNNEALKKFVSQNKRTLNQCGCYIFYKKAGKGTIPIYVGKTSISFEKEIFTSDKLKKIEKYFSKSVHKKIHIQFICYPKKQGKINNKKINELERYLIQESFKKNPEILNKHHASMSTWIIKDYHNPKQGRPSHEANILKSILL